MTFITNLPLRLMLILGLFVCQNLTAQTYCPSKGNLPWQEWIAGVKFGTINNTSSKEGYGDFTNQTTNLTRGTSYPLSITQGFSYAPDAANATQQGKVWIDYNKNGTFETTELVASFTRTTTTANVVVPTTALLGATRMRVSLKTTGVPTACEVFDKGEVEDYTVNITGGTTATGRDTLRILNVTGPDALPQGGTVTLNVTLKNTGTAPSIASRRMGIYETSGYQGDFYKWFDVTNESNFVAIGQSIAPNATVTVPMTFRLSNTFTSKSPLATKGRIEKGKLIAFDNMSLGRQDFAYSGTVDTLYRNLPFTSFVDLSNGDLSVEIIAPDTTYGGDNTIRYSVKVRNLSNQTVRNVQSVLYGFRLADGSFTEIVRPSKGVFERVNPYPSEFNLGNWTIGDMAAGEIATSTVELTLGGSFYNPVKYISVSVQSNQLDETNTANNNTNQSFIFSTTKPRAELSVSNLRVNPSVASQTDSITVSVDVNNTGNLAATFGVSIYLRLNANDSMGGFSTDGYFNQFGSISLAPNSSVSLTKRFGLNTTVPQGNYFLQILADAGYQVPEVNEYNNRIATPFQVRNQTQNSCRTQDSLQLVSLYNATGGANWTIKWNLATPINTWYGVTLTSDGCVESLVPQSINLSGTIPNLNLPNLKTLNLSNNLLIGTIPDFNLPKLVTLNLSSNKLTGSIPLFNQTNMGFLDLSRNQLTGSVPNFTLSGVYAVNGLYVVDLSRNKLTGKMPAFNLLNLRGLDLSYNQLSDTIPTFAGLQNIVSMYLNNNQFTGNFPVNIGAGNGYAFRSESGVLNLDSNRLSGCLPVNLKSYCSGSPVNLYPIISFKGNPNLTTQSYDNFCNFGEGGCSYIATINLNISGLVLRDRRTDPILNPYAFVQGSTVGGSAGVAPDIYPLAGSVSAGGFRPTPFQTKVRAYISTDRLTDANDYVLSETTYTIVPNTAGNNFYFEGGYGFGTGRIPVNFPVGNYFLIVKIDADNAIAETNEGDNLDISAFQIIAPPTVSSSVIALSIASTPSVYRIYTTHSFKITAVNKGTTAYTNVKIKFTRPLLTVSGGAKTASIGTFQDYCPGNVECSEWTIPSLAVGATATLDAPIFILAPTGGITATATLLSSTPTIAANTLATITVNSATAAQAPPSQALAFRVPTQLIPVVIQAISPNPTEGDVQIKLDSWTKQTVDFNFSDITGKVIHSEKRDLEKGVNRLDFEVFHLPQGVYFIQTNVGKGKDVPTKFVKM